MISFNPHRQGLSSVFYFLCFLNLHFLINTESEEQKSYIACLVVYPAHGAEEILGRRVP